MKRPAFLPARIHPLLAVGLLATLALLLAHAAEYAFLTDDAFISFRYARNLADGHGLVFNPGFERVEGYTNFLWVVLLAVFALAGAAPESVAPVLTLAATVALWALVAGYALRSVPAGRRWLALIPPLLLGATRSVAVWSTGGLETRLFEVLVLGGVLRLLSEVRATLGGKAPAGADAADPRRRPAATATATAAAPTRSARPPASALLFALATLTRPDGLLVWACATSAAATALALRHRLAPRRFAAGPALYVVLVGAHFLFRRLYYGEWLPNTYYAKVAGRFWWEMGWTHHASLALEYAAYLWVPLIAVAVVRHVRRGTGHVPGIFAAVVLPHVVYVASVGGDHFEYRPQDLYFPFAFLLIGDALVSFATRGRGRATAPALPDAAPAAPAPATTLATLAATAVLLAGLTLLPWRSHVQFPRHYLAGFPGWAGSGPEGRFFLHPDRDPVYRIPGLRSVAAAHRRLLGKTTRGFVGIRAEEHRLFRERVRPEAERLRQLVRDGVIPADAHFALDSVGVIPYVSDLRVLDRLGLTDAHVARSGELSRDRLLAHEKRASLDYARERGVDFWAFDSVHSLYRAGDPRFHELVRTAVEHRIPASVADVGGGFYLFGLLLQGPEEARRRFPHLTFRSVLEPGAIDALRVRPGAP